LFIFFFYTSITNPRGIRRKKRISSYNNYSFGIINTRDKFSGYEK